jgi:hypothetical protein
VGWHVARTVLKPVSLDVAAIGSTLFICMCFLLRYDTQVSAGKLSKQWDVQIKRLSNSLMDQLPAL